MKTKLQQLDTKIIMRDKFKGKKQSIKISYRNYFAEIFI